MLGAFLQAAKGVIDNVSLKDKNRKLEQILEVYSNPSNIINEIEDPFDRTMSINQLIMAEYMLERLAQEKDINKIKTLWERAKTAMNENISNIEEELKKQKATKLDIARLITGLSQMSGEFDKELLSLSNSYDQEANHIKKLEERVEKQQTQYEAMQNNNEENLKNTKNELNSAINRLNEDYQSSIQKLKNESEQNVEKLEKELGFIHDQLSSNIRLLEESLENHQNQLVEVAKQIEGRIILLQNEQEETTKNQKNLILKLTIPLYIIVGLLVAYWIYK